MEYKIKISPAKLKGDDGYKSFSIRVPEEICDALDNIAAQTGRSRNEIITILLKEGVEHVEVE